MEGQIYGERVAAMATANPNFMAEQRAIYDVVRTQTAARQEAAAAEAQLQAIAEEQQRQLCLLRAADKPSAGAAVSIVDLTSPATNSSWIRMAMGKVWGG